MKTNVQKIQPRKASGARTAWANSEVQPLDLGQPYQPVAHPLQVKPASPCAQPLLYPMPNQLYQADTAAMLRRWPQGCFDACITDPPYNIARRGKGMSWAFSSHKTIDNKWDAFSPRAYEAFTRRWLKEVCRVVKPNGNIFIFGSYHNIYTIGAMAGRMDLRIINSIVWIKPNAQPNITCRMFTESTEQVLWLCNNTTKKATGWTFHYQHMKQLAGGKQMRNFWEFPVVPQRERLFGKHPAQKPLRLMERIVLASTNPNDKVLDCFAGSGSTLLACDRLNRKWVGIERDNDYCKLAHRRLDEERRQRRLFEEGSL